MIIKIKRVYDIAAPQDGYRVLVDRIWPRGISKEAAHLDEWNKNLAPSHELRKWFNHEPDKWAEFSTKYTEELNSSNFCEQFILQNQKQEIITLVFAAKDVKHCHPLVLKKRLDELINDIKKC